MENALYRESPAPPGAGLACLWSHELSAGASGPFEQLVVPDGCVDLVWWSREARVMVAGPDTGPAPARLEPGDRLVAVRFGPGTAPPVLGVPADAVRDGRPLLRELWGAEADRLGEAMAVAGHPHAVLVDAVRGRGRAGGGPDPLAAALVAALADGGASQGVRDAAGALGVSERQLRRRSHAAFGYGPKMLQRVLRFQRALRMARAGRPLAETAVLAGFADQAHMANEVRGLGGVTIGELL